MNRTGAELPRKMLLANTAVALMAAVGMSSILSQPGGGPPSLAGVVVFTIPLAAVLMMTGQRAVAEARQEGRFQAMIDPSTGLATPFAAERELAMEFAAAQRGRPLAVVLIRLDGLPGYAARHGKPVTDQLLRLASRTLALHRREMHLTAHYGPVPGWYLSVLSGMELGGATIYAKRMRKALMALSRLPEPPEVSVAVVPYDLSMATPDDLVLTAERALKAAPADGAGGGGRILVAGQPQPTQEA